MEIYRSQPFETINIIYNNKNERDFIQFEEKLKDFTKKVFLNDSDKNKII